MTVSDVATGMATTMAMPEATPNVGASTRARARLDATHRDRKAVLARAVATVRADLMGAWMWHNHPPSLAQLWARRVPAQQAIPGNCETPASHVLWVAETCWRTAAVLLFTPVVVAVWLLHRAVTGVPTIAVVAGLVAMWHVAGRGGVR